MSFSKFFVVVVLFCNVCFGFVEFSVEIALLLSEQLG